MATIIHIPFLQGHPPKIKYHKKKTNCLEVLLSTKPKQKASCQGQYSLVLAHFKHIARNTFNHKSSPQNKEWWSTKKMRNDLDTPGHKFNLNHQQRENTNRAKEN